VVSRRRRRQGIGKIVVSVESRIRKIEKNPSPKRLKANVVTTEKLGFRAVTTKTVAPDAITPNEAAFGTTVVTPTQPTEYLKEGLTWVNPDDGATNVYSTTANDFVTVTDAAAVSIAQGKSKTYVQNDEPTGGTYSLGDLWIDTNDGNKLYAYTGSAWALKQDSASALASANGKNTIYRQTSQPTGGTYVTGDTWFDSDDDNKIYRYNGTAWVAVQLGGNGLANINANSITTGTIDASVITVSNLDAGKITTGTINVGGSIKISTSPSSSGTAARVEINSTGFYAYDGSVATVSITNTGTAVFSGTIYASAGTFTGSISGSTITGGTFRTAASGSRIELTSTSSNRIDFYGSGTTQGYVTVNDYRMFMYAPGSSLGAGAVLSLYGDQQPTYPNGVFITGGAAYDLTLAMSGSTVSLSQGTYGIRVSAGGVAVDGAAPAGSYMVRNARITTSAPTSGASSGTTDGNIVLVREA
jgi:hypothetical protein